MWINYDLYVNTRNASLNLYVSTSNATKQSKKQSSK